MGTLADVDLTDPRLYAEGDPHAVWRLLRREAPVFFQTQRRGPGFWAITKHADVLRISADPHSFISSGGMSTSSDPLAGETNLDGNLLVTTDPPLHTKMRSLVNKGFTPRMIGRLEPFVRNAVTMILDEVLPHGECDFAQDAAAKLPFTVICELLGVPTEDRPQLYAAVEHMLEQPGTNRPTEPSRFPNVNAYFQRLADERREDPADDLVSVLVHAEVDGERLSAPDLLLFCGLLFVAGSETTMNAISGGLLALIEHPEQLERLERDPSLMPKAVEEILRWTSPVLVSMIRTATRDVELHGTTIRRGDKVALWYPSANRDEDAFPDPDHFDLARSPNNHLAFGFGEHFCLGANLARLEIRVMIEEALRRMHGIELAGSVERLRSNIFWSITEMPVRFTAA